MHEKQAGSSLQPGDLQMPLSAPEGRMLQRRAGLQLHTCPSLRCEISLSPVWNVPSLDEQTAARSSRAAVFVPKINCRSCEEWAVALGDRSPPSRPNNWGAGQAVREWSARQQWPQLSPRCEHPNWPLTLGDRPDGLVHRQRWRGVKSSVSRTLATTEMDLSRPRAIVMLRGNDHLFEPGPHVGSQDHVRPPHSKGCSNVVAAS
jgi:hypothetical protein